MNTASVSPAFSLDYTDVLKSIRAFLVTLIGIFLLAGLSAVSQAMTNGTLNLGGLGFAQTVFVSGLAFVTELVRRYFTDHTAAPTA